ncbi:transcriptional regulator [Halobiforma lacisalsi AJ5]|uniref:Transcriptional regulator n=1 Tax=Natronobacterium lacisalsi AJ5 TaxID=358396 RepID=M0LM14_NATLA|nr:MarR family transcriptional regulator [Halobiforma lacisalsi]APW98536.1 transcriptional regulator [Halobiforma lacisalsi AJ5]EMA33065.1 MarR family transcriptional regulator [Halobiforma lacisalsi AJ5]
MDLSALHGKHLGAAAVFVAAIFVLATQLITPSPVMVSVGENGTETTQLGQYFTYTDVAIIAVAASLLGASGTYLFLLESFTTAATAGSSGRSVERTENRSSPTAQPRTTERTAVTRGDATVQFRDRDQQEQWEETVARLQNHEETVYSTVLDADGTLPQREIVADTDLSKATVSRTLDTLEGKGLVERKRRGMGNVVVLK